MMDLEGFPTNLNIHGKHTTLSPFRLQSLQNNMSKISDLAFQMA
jgi:hypothetical protein